MGRRKDYKHSEETKLKMSKRRKEWLQTHEHPRGGKAIPAETRARMASDLSKLWKRVGHPKGMAGKHHSGETKRKMSLTKQGNRNPNWSGGLKELVAGIRGSPEYYQWRKAVFVRDSYTCRDCGILTMLNAHHIKSIIDYPDGIFEVENGITLCGDCHKRLSLWQRIRRFNRGGR